MELWVSVSEKRVLTILTGNYELFVVESLIRCMLEHVSFDKMSRAYAGSLQNPVTGSSE